MSNGSEIEKLKKRITELQLLLQNKQEQLDLYSEDYTHPEYLQLNEELSASNEELAASNDALKESYDHVSQLNEQIESQRFLYESVFDAMPGNLIIFDKNMNVVKTNKNTLKSKQLANREIKCYTLFSNRSQKCNFCSANTSMELGVFVKKEEWDPVEQIYKEVRFFPIKDSEGNIVYTGEIWFDISKRREAEKEIYRLYLSLLKERSMFMNGNVVVFHWKNDPSWSIEYVSANVLDIFGYTEKDFLEGNICYKNIIFSDDIAMFENTVCDAIKEKKVNFSIDDYRVIRKDGGIIWLSHFMTIIYDDNKNLLNFYGHVTNITKRKIAEKALESSEKRFNSIYENSALGFYRTSADGNVVMANPALVRMLKFESVDQLFKKKINTGYVNIEDKILFDKLIKEKGEVVGFESKWIRNDGSIIHIRENAVAVFDNDAHILYHEGTVEDISDKKEAEINLLIAKEKAEEADRLKSAFLANMSHEIRTPLNGILGFAQLLENEDLKPEDKKKYIEVINISGNRLLSVINDILEISKLEVGQLKIYPETFKINKLLTTLFEIFKQNAELKGIEIVYLPEGLHDIEIFSDENRISQILTNLIQNAIKFTDKGNVTFGYTTDNSFIKFFVHDTGIGIRKEKQKIIFDRFRQSEEFISKKYGGTGLGLSISQGLVKLLGGQMFLESEPGKGAKFSFTIPLNK